MNIDEVPQSLGLTDKMREAYAQLNIDTPFSVWAQAKLWEAITTEQRRATNRNITTYKEE